LGRDIRVPSGARQDNSNKYGMFLWTQWEDGLFYASAAGRISWRSNMLRLTYEDSGSACKLAQDMVPTAHTQIEVRA